MATDCFSHTASATLFSGQVQRANAGFLTGGRKMSRSLSLVILGVAAVTAIAADDAKYLPIDIQPYATQKRGDGLGRGLEGNHLANVPGGEQVFGGVKF